MLSLDDALAIVLSGARGGVTPIETIDLAGAVGRTLAKDVLSAFDVPAQPVSRMDGYAVCTASLGRGFPQRLPVVGRSAAGDPPRHFPPVGAVRIFTGAPLPIGFDAVLMQEAVVREGDDIVVAQSPEAGDWVRPLGSDVRSGDCVTAAGSRLTPAQLGLLATMGLAQLAVHARLKVAVLSTGSELVAPGSALRPGQIYNSNGPMLCALVQAQGAELVHHRHVADDLQATQDALSHAATHAELIITSGGVSVGEEDHVRAAIERDGQLDLWKVAIKPGKPFALGQYRGTPVLGLPGNPVSAYVTFFMLVAPYVRQRQGVAQVHAPSITLTAGFAHKADRQRREFLRASLLAEGLLGLANDQTSSMLRSVADAQFLIDVPIGRDISVGDPVRCLPLAF